MLLYILLLVEVAFLRASPATSSLLPQTDFATRTPPNVTMTENNKKMLLTDVVKTVDEMPSVSFSELKRLLTEWRPYGVKVKRFDLPSDHKKAGRVKIFMGQVMQNPLFQYACPTFYSLYDMYRKHSKSFCIMLTYEFWLHADLRCLVDSLLVPRDSSSYSSYLESKMNGEGPDEDVTLLGHQLAGETDFTVAVIAKCTDHLSTFRAARIDPRKVPAHMQESLVRKAGTLTSASAALHGGAYTAKPGDNGLEFEKISFRDGEKPRVLHCAFGGGSGRVALSVLATVQNQHVEALLAGLSKIAEKQPSHRQPEPEVQAFFARDGQFHCEAADFERASPGGTGGLTPAEHKDISCGTEGAENSGLVYKDKEDGSFSVATPFQHKENSCGTEGAENSGLVYKDEEDGSFSVATPFEHKENCCGTEGAENSGLVYKDKADGSFSVATAKKHGQGIWKGMQSTGNYGGHACAVREPGDAEINCAALDDACGIGGEWTAKSTTGSSRGKPIRTWVYSSRSGLQALMFTKADGGLRTWGGFTAAKKLCLAYAASAGAKRPKLGQLPLAFASGSSATAPIELDG